MKRLAVRTGLLVAGLLAGVCGTTPANAQAPTMELYCNKTGIAASAPATVAVVTGVAGRAVNICGWIVSATAAATMQVITGTGATCGTATVNITAAHAVPAGGVQGYESSNAQFSTPAGNRVCVIIGGTGPVQLTLFYSQ
jgi:hypothetical protein